MRASLFPAAVVAALALTGWTSRDAQAQIVVYPTINTSPYASPYVYPVNYTYPAYSYGYNYGYPGYRSWSYGWSNPYSTWNWSYYRNYPVYNNYYWGGSPYRRGYWRW